MFKNFKQIEYTFNELNCQFTTFVHSLLLENQNLRLDIDKIDVNHCRQLANIRFVNNELNKSLAKQVQCIINERNQLSREKAQLMLNNLVKIRNMESLIAAERKLNIELNEDMLRLRKEITEKDEFLNREMNRKIEETKNNLIINYQTAMEFNQKTWAKKILQVDCTLCRLEDFLPTVAKTFSKLKLENQNSINKLNQIRVQYKNVTMSVQKLGNKLREEITYLRNEKIQVNDLINQLKIYIPTMEKMYRLKFENEKANQIIQFNEVLKTEQNTNIKLKDEITYLKNENIRTDNWWKLEVQRKVTKSKNEITEYKNMLNNLHINLETTVIRGNFKCILKHYIIYYYYYYTYYVNI